MPAYKDGKYISVPCDGPLLNRVTAFADNAEVSLAQACAMLIDYGLKSLDEQDIAPAQARWRASTIALLENVPNDWMIEEVARRMSAGVGSDEYDAAIARAEEAEGKLAQIAATLGSAAA